MQYLHKCCILQSVLLCDRLCRHKFENCVYALEHISHLYGFIEPCICICCLSPLDDANVLPQDEHAKLRCSDSLPDDNLFFFIS